MLSRALRTRLTLGCLFTLSLSFVARAGHAQSAPSPHAAATRLASLSPAQCRNELTRRRIETKPARGAHPGIATPLRLVGPLQGIRFRAPGERSVYGILDCRLLLALDDFARVLADAGVVEVHVDNYYRPHAHLPGRRDKPSQHAYGLAADIEAFTLRDGRTLRVEQDWHAELGPEPCADGNESAESPTLRRLVCSALQRGLFSHVLTPNTDAAHQNHLHFDIARARPHVVRATPRKAKGKRR